MHIDVVRLLNAMASTDAKALVMALGQNRLLSPALRAEAALGLDSTKAKQRSVLLRLVSDPEHAVCHEALRSLRATTFDEDERQMLLEITKRDQSTAELVDRILTNKLGTRPDVKDTEAWLTLLKGPANAQAGRRVFFTPRGQAVFVATVSMAMDTLCAPALPVAESVLRCPAHV